MELLQYTYILRPTGAGSNYLKVILVKEGAQFIIGRNNLTFANVENIDIKEAASVSRRHASLDIFDGDLYINCCSR